MLLIQSMHYKNHLFGLKKNIPKADNKEEIKIYIP